MEALSDYLAFRLQQVEKERRRIIEKIKELDQPNSISSGGPINPATVPSYPIMSTWFERIKFILQQEQQSLTLREIATRVLIFEPRLAKEKSLKLIIPRISSIIIQNKTSFYYDTSNGLKRTRYSLQKQPTLDRYLDLTSVYPWEGTWPKKIEHIMLREGRKLTFKEIMEYVLRFEPELIKEKTLLRGLISRPLNMRKDLFCKEKSDGIKGFLYYLKNTNILDVGFQPLPSYSLGAT